jgi:hypothetical protein
MFLGEVKWKLKILGLVTKQLHSVFTFRQRNEVHGRILKSKFQVHRYFYNFFDGFVFKMREVERSTPTVG